MIFYRTSLSTIFKQDRHLIRFTHVPLYRLLINFACLVLTKDCSMAEKRILLSSWTSCCWNCSLFDHPKLSVNFVVVHESWSKSMSWENRRCSSISITRCLLCPFLLLLTSPRSSWLNSNRFSLKLDTIIVYWIVYKIISDILTSEFGG